MSSKTSSSFAAVQQCARVSAITCAPLDVFGVVDGVVGDQLVGDTVRRESATAPRVTRAVAAAARRLCTATTDAGAAASPAQPQAGTQPHQSRPKLTTAAAVHEKVYVIWCAWQVPPCGRQFIPDWRRDQGHVTLFGNLHPASMKYHWNCCRWRLELLRTVASQMKHCALGEKGPRNERDHGDVTHF